MYLLLTIVLYPFPSWYLCLIECHQNCIFCYKILLKSCFWDKPGKFSVKGWKICSQRLVVCIHVVPVPVKLHTLMMLQKLIRTPLHTHIKDLCTDCPDCSTGWVSNLQASCWFTLPSRFLLTWQWCPILKLYWLHVLLKITESLVWELNNGFYGSSKICHRTHLHNCLLTSQVADLVEHLTCKQNIVGIVLFKTWKLVGCTPKLYVFIYVWVLALFPVLKCFEDTVITWSFHDFAINDIILLSRFIQFYVLL